MSFRLGFRAHLNTVVAIAAVAFASIIVAGALTTQRAEDELTRIQKRYLPRVALAPELTGRFERLRRNLQDAVAAQDLKLLADTRLEKEQLLDRIEGARGSLEPVQTDALRDALNTWYHSAHDVSRRLIADETGEDLVGAMAAMQTHQTQVSNTLARAVAFDRSELEAAFDAVARSQATAERVRLLVSLVCLLLVLLLSFQISRRFVRSLSALTAGLRRFGEGDFDQPISTTNDDELGDVAHQANQMAASLRRLREEQRLTDWMKSGQAGLAVKVSGERSSREVAQRATSYLTRHLGVPAAALYVRDDDGLLRLLARHGLGDDDPGTEPVIEPGEGLIGQAALTTGITCVEEPPPTFLRLKTGLGEGAPRALVLVPLVHAGAVIGVLELAFFKAYSPAADEFLLAARDTLATALEVARAGERLRELFHEKERQAEQLVLQEAALREKADELTAASAYKSQFLANMSHELRTPLNAIIGFSELLYDGIAAPGEPLYRESLDHVLTSGRHLLDLINDVLDLSKVEAGRLAFHPQALDLDATIHDVLAALQPLAARKHIEVTADIDPTLSELWLDPGRLRQVLNNFMSNALKFTAERGRVSVRAVPEGADQLRIEVEDNGIGITQEDLGRLFVEFQQVGSVAQRQSGTGLGLALTRRLVEHQGGSVGVRSTPGVGSVFHAVLPRRWQALEEPGDLRDAG